eukprot:SAG31_NODE_2940_length_4882_cov_7.133807_7_plen_100_part_00
MRIHLTENYGLVRMVAHALKASEVSRREMLEKRERHIEEQQTEFKQRTKTHKQWLDGMERRIARRKMLFEQATQDALRKQVLEKFDETLMNAGVGFLAE